MTRLTQSDIIRAQEARIDSLTLMVERLTAMHGEALAALTESRKQSAAQTIKLARGATGDHTTGIAVEFVVQEGETETEAVERAQVEYERLAARYPMANGLTHAAPLSSDLADVLEASAK